MINRSPKVLSPTTDLHKDLVQVPLPLRTLLHTLRSTFADLVREVSAEPIDPVTDRFVANVDAAFMEQVFNIPQLQRKSDIHHDCKLDDLRRGFEVAERVPGHFPRLDAPALRLKAVCPDNA
jgi:hypothetical protein